MSQQKFRILSYNIHKGIGFLKRDYVLSGIKKLIEEHQADVAFLQEVCGHHPKPSAWHQDFANQIEFLADKTWPHFAYGKNAVYKKGNHGNAILSRYPIKQSDNYDLSVIPLIARRGLLHAQIEGPEKHIHLFNIHLDLFEWVRQRQVNKIIDCIEQICSDHEPLILCGDFNDWRRLMTQHLFQSHNLKEAFATLHQRYARTFPVWRPFLSLDRVYYRGLVPMQAKIINNSLTRQFSDHCALLVDFRCQT